MSNSKPQSFWKKTSSKVIIVTGIIAALAALLNNLDSIQNFFQSKFGEKKGLNIVDVSVDDTLKNSDTTKNIDTALTGSCKHDTKISNVNFNKQSVDIKLRNNGNEVALIKRVEIEIKKKWVLIVEKGVTYSEKPSSATYDININTERNTPFTLKVNVSHEIKPNETDRFTMTLKNGPGAFNTYVYLADLNIFFNEGDEPISKHNLLFAFESNQSNTYKKNDDRNLQSINEINMVEEEKNSLIKKLISKILDSTRK